MKTNNRSLDNDARLVVGLVRQHLPSAEVIWAYGEGKEPSAEEITALQIQHREAQGEAAAQFEKYRRDRISAVVMIARKADTAAIFARAFANVGNADLAEKWAIIAYRRRRESLIAAFEIRHLVFSPEEMVELCSATPAKALSRCRPGQ
jgi:hypothetical protein